nr:receptor like protein 30 [Quercus suber]
MVNYNHTVVVFLLLSLIFKLGSCTENQSQTNNVTVKCIQSEREALVRFKAGVIDFPGKLSSWFGEDCCQWKGVKCDNESGHVTQLNLSNPAGRHRHFDYPDGLVSHIGHGAGMLKRLFQGM